MASRSNTAVGKPRRLTSDDVLLSDVEEADLQAVAEGLYATFPDYFLTTMEPPAKSDVPVSVRAARFAKRMKPWLTSPDGKWIKATLKTGPEKGKIIGHAGWLRPVPGGERVVFHHWRRDAVDVLGWKQQMGWTDEEIEEMWEHVDLVAWQRNFAEMDEVRKETMKGRAHWLLAPLWVLPEYQGSGVSSLLLKETLDLADAEDPPTAAYLVAARDARKVYERFGFEALPGSDSRMVRWTTPKPKDP